MKVLLINPFLTLGGGEQIVVRLARYFTQQGHQVSIACAFADETYMAMSSDVTLLLPPKYIAKLSQQQKILLIVLGLPGLFFVVLFHAFSFDILFPHNFPGIFYAGIAAVLYRKPLVWEFNEGAPLFSFFSFLETLVGHRADAIIVLDEKNKKLAMQRFGITPICIRPGVDAGFWGKSAARDKRFAKKIVLLSVGKLHKQKNQIILPDVVKKLRGTLPNIHVVLVGDGPDKNRIQVRARKIGVAKLITFLGRVSDEQLRSLYRTAFLVVFPALDQTWGLTPFEALCQQTISIVSDEAGAAEILVPQKIGISAHPTVDEFVAATFRARHMQISQMGKRGKLYVEQHLSWEQFCRTTLAICQKVYEKKA